MIPDPIRFCESLVNPETGRPFVLTDAERLFLQHAFALTGDGRLRYPELVWSAPKKSGKTAFAAMLILYGVRILGGRFGEGYCAANDFEQSQGRVFQAAARIVTATPMLAADAVVTGNKIEFASTGATITAIASDYAGAAGSNPNVTVFDELWGYTSERATRLWDEMIPPPTRQIACRLTVTYAGFEGESTLLEGLYKRGLAGEQLAPDLYAAGPLLMFWTHGFTAPWQTPQWRDQMREQHRPNAYLRQIENRWVSSESPFIPTEWWDECTTVNPVVADCDMPVWVGIDASFKHDSTAIVACTWDDRAQRVRLVFHRIFHPSPDEPLDFEATVEATVLEMQRRFRLVAVLYDPYQMVSVAQRLTARRVPMREFPQTTQNLTEASNNLYELLKGRNVALYPDAEMRLAAQRSIAIEGSRGWRIAKDKTTHKIDVVVALAQAALGAVQSVTASPQLWQRSALLVDGGPARWPTPCDLLFATVALGDDGAATWMTWAKTGPQAGPPLMLVDFGEVRPYSPAVFAEVRDRINADAQLAKPQRGRKLIADPVILAQATAAFAADMDAMWHPGMGEDQLRALELVTEKVDGDLIRNPALLTAAIAVVAQGSVKLGPAAYEAAMRTPLGLLDFTADEPRSAVRAAALLGLASLIDPQTIPGLVRPAPRGNPNR